MTKILEMPERKMETCKHVNSWFGFTYCKAWKWRRKPIHLIEMFPEVEFKRVKPEGEKLWYVSPHH